ncbi:MAG: GNAT family N-acetyltransferase [Oscillospiraceae bacterium]|jgi:ribosomal protein S18 acetylase RimI-like enzyme|nr:GNAT family N-acetyltransferase [Oscillospiraceae bacterium]
MAITYAQTRQFTSAQLKDLFNSVGWESARFSDKLVTAMHNSENVVSAWDGDQLVGLMTAMSDGVMTVYFHWLLVRPEYQGQGIGRTITEKMLENYKSYISRILLSYNEQVGFYEKLGFAVNTLSTPMKHTGKKEK